MPNISLNQYIQSEERILDYSGHLNLWRTTDITNKKYKTDATSCVYTLILGFRLKNGLCINVHTRKERQPSHGTTKLEVLSLELMREQEHSADRWLQPSVSWTYSEYSSGQLISSSATTTAP